MTNDAKNGSPEVEKLKNELGGRRAAFNELLLHIQELETENKSLVQQRVDQRKAIDDLESQLRKEKSLRVQSDRTRKLCELWFDLAAQHINDLQERLIEDAESLPKEAQPKYLEAIHLLNRITWPKDVAVPHILDFSRQLHKWSDDNEQFKKLLSDMGMEHLVTLAQDLNETEKKQEQDTR